MMKMHIEGGMNYMVPLTILFLFNLGIVVFLLFATFTKKKVSSFWLEMVRQVGGLALVWGVLSTIVGFYQAFDDLSKMDETVPFAMIMGGLRVALITANYGMIIFVISLTLYLGLRIMNKSSLNINMFDKT